MYQLGELIWVQGPISGKPPNTVLQLELQSDSTGSPACQIRLARICNEIRKFAAPVIKQRLASSLQQDAAVSRAPSRGSITTILRVK